MCAILNGLNKRLWKEKPTLALCQKKKRIGWFHKKFIWRRIWKYKVFFLLGFLEECSNVPRPGSTWQPANCSTFSSLLWCNQQVAGGTQGSEVVYITLPSSFPDRPDVIHMPELIWQADIQNVLGLCHLPNVNDQWQTGC